MTSLTIYKIPTIQDKYLSIANKLFIIWEGILLFLSLMFGIRILTVEFKMQIQIANKLLRSNQSLIDLEKSRVE
jgi:hypothetical protein